MTLCAAGCTSSSRDARSDHFVRLGVAVVDSSAGWCAMFSPADSTPALRTGDRVTIIWVDTTTERASGPGRIVGVRRGGCSGNGEGRALAYELVLDDSVDVADSPMVAHVVTGVSAWRFGAHGWAYGDAEGDGVEDIARGCTSQEGYHATLWRQRRGDTRPVLRAHYYHSLGYDVTPSCTAEETVDPR